jgi:hypothetical protein
MKHQLTIAFLLTGVTFLPAEPPADKMSMPDCPMMNDHAAMNARGDKGMGFSQEKTTHHFVLSPAGGSIEVVANEKADTASRQQIQMHLGHIAKMFQNGNFEIPMFVHGKTPDGVPVMQKHKDEISYKYQSTRRGGRVQITTKNPEALKAVHEFLRFQIVEHQTGDASAVKSE